MENTQFVIGPTGLFELERGRHGISILDEEETSRLTFYKFRLLIYNVYIREKKTEIGGKKTFKK